MISPLLVFAFALGLTIPLQAASGQAPPSPFHPDTVLTPPAGPTTVMLGAPGAPVIALRLHVPLREEVSEAGAGEILRRMGLARASSIAEQVGARLDAVRTPTGIAYTVTGPAADFDHLVWILRRVTAEPGPERFRRMRAELLGELEGSSETPGAVLGQLLRIRAAPSLPPPDGTEPALEAFDHARLVDTWRRSHRREDLTLVLVGPVAPEAVLAALMELGIPSPREAEVAVPSPSDPPAGAARQPEVIRHWYGEAYPGTDGDDPRALVAARLVSERLREAPGTYEVGVEAWEVGEEIVLAVIGAAYPGNAASLRQRIQGLRSETRASLTSEAVERAKSRIRRDLLSEARTPWGLANLLGRQMEQSGDPLAAERYLGRLAEIEHGEMDAFFAALEGVEALTAEVRP